MDVGGALDPFLEGAHGNGAHVVVQKAENRGVDGRGIDHGLVTLHVDDDLGLGGRGRLGHAVGAGGVIGARHDHAGAKVFSRRADALVIGGDHHVREIARLGGAFPHVLQHGLTGDGDEGFAGETRGRVPCGDYTKNPLRHTRI